MFKIRVSNFQSIELEEVEVSGFTTITGRSNIGKTALLRAVTSSIFNKPVGSYLRDPKKPVLVNVQGPDIDYEWKKGEKQINQYLINGKTYDKCGTDGLTVLKPDWFKSIRLGDKDVYPWYAPQFNPLFLIDETSGRISEFFAEFCRIGLITKAIKIATAHKKEQDMLAKHLEAQISRLTESILKFESLKKYKGIAKDLEEQKISIEQFENGIELRVSYEAKINSSRKYLGVLGAISRTNVPEIATLEKAISEYSNLTILDKDTTQAVYRYFSLAAINDARIPDPPEFPRVALLEKAAKLQRIVKNKVVPQVPAPPSANDVKQLQELQSKLDKLYDSFVFLKTGVNKIKVADIRKEYYQYKIILEKDKTTQIQNRIRAVLGQIRTVEEELSKIPKCPSCERPIGHTHDQEGTESTP